MEKISKLPVFHAGSWEPHDHSGRSSKGRRPGTYLDKWIPASAGMIRIEYMASHIDDFKKFSQNTILHLKEDLKLIRTGRANPSVLEDLSVEAYGGTGKFKLRELATLTTEGSMQIVISPFDPVTTGDIERAILKSPLGYTPISQGGRIIIRIPPLSTEQRQKLTKIVNQKIEDKKQSIRANRDETRKKIKTEAEANTITKDDRFRMEKDIDTETTKIMAEMETIKMAKDKEIMEV